jgi:outer membrane protein
MNSKVRSFTVKSIVSVCLALASAASASAQTPSQTAGQPPTKVAVIYFQGAIVGTKDGQKAAADLDSKAGPKRKELELKQNDVNSLQDQYNKGQNTLSDAAKNELLKNIEFKKKALQRDFEDAKEDFDQEQQKLLQQLAQKMTAVIERYAHDHGYTLVVDVSSPQSPVLFASTSIDITKDIIDLYDQSSAAMSNPAPAKPASSLAAPKPATPAKPPATKPPGSN